MKAWKSRSIANRLGALSLALSIFFMGVPAQVFAAPVVDIKANGADGSITITASESFTYSWSTLDATACSLTSPQLLSGISLNGSDGPISSGHPWFPATGSSATFTLNCTDGTDSTSDSVTVNVVDNTPAPIPTTPSVDIKAENSDGPVTITHGASFSYSWTSLNATACEITSPSALSGLTLNGNDGPITPAHSWYPTVGGSVTLTAVCTDGSNTASDSVTITSQAPNNPIPTTPTADIKANGSDGPVTITQGEAWNYSWTSLNATACEITSPTPVSGITLNGNDGPIPSNHPWYPTAASSTVLTLSCTNGVNTATDQVVINLATPNNPVPTTPTADIKANGSDGPVTITQGEAWNYSWTSLNATACQLISSKDTSHPSGITLNGNDGPIPSNHPWYPTTASSTILTLNCTNGTSTATDSVEIRVVSDNNNPQPTCPVPSITSSTTASVRVSNSFSYTLTATTSVATTTSFSITSALPSWLSYATSTATLSGTPTDAGTFNVTFVASADCGSDTETLVITVDNPSSGGGGGGGSSSGGGRSRSRGSSSGQVLGATTVNMCPFLNTYLRAGYANDAYEVMKLQAFLQTVEKFDYVQVNGVFDEATLLAVHAFQERYEGDVLAPWGISESTGYVYITTQGKINQIVCGSGIPDVPKAIGKVLGDKDMGGYKEGRAGNTATSVPIIGDTVGKGQNHDNDRGNGLAAALFSWPDSALEILQCLYELLLILIVLYVIGTILENVLYKDNKENVLKRFLAKWLSFTIGSLAAFFIAYYANEYCLLLPLLIAFLASLVWTVYKWQKLITPKVLTLTESKTTTTLVNIPESKEEQK